MVLCGTGRNNVSKLESTGIPPHIIVANEIAQTKQEILASKEEFNEKLERIPEKIKEHILQNFEVAPITFQPVENMIRVENMIKGIESTILNSITNNRVKKKKEFGGSRSEPN